MHRRSRRRRGKAKWRVHSSGTVPAQCSAAPRTRPHKQRKLLGPSVLSVKLASRPLSVK